MTSRDLGNLVGQTRAYQELCISIEKYVKTLSIEKLIEICRFHCHMMGVEFYLSNTMYWCAYSELCDRFNNNHKLVNKMIEQRT